jgi:hypothetical protein
MDEGYTLINLREALIFAIKLDTGKEPVNPKSNKPDGVLYFIDGKIYHAKSQVQKESGSFWQQPKKTNGYTLYDRGQIAGILDYLSTRTDGEKPLDINLTRVPVNPRIIEIAERKLFADLEKTK